jgi:GNAT superfamily N-acetyltransferase
MDVLIKKGEKRDLPSVLKLIKELAEYEKALKEVEVTIEELERDGFGDNKIFDFFVAIINSEIVGMALYYTKYSTWKGKCIYLDDIVVTEKMRGKKIGAKLFEAVIEVCKHKGVRRMEWQVLEWNKPAINFYNKYKAILDPEWINGKLTDKQLALINN